MKIHFDQAADALYIILGDADVLESEDVQPGVIVHVDDENRVVAIEILRAFERLPSANLRQIEFEVAQGPRPQPLSQGERGDCGLGLSVNTRHLPPFPVLGRGTERRGWRKR